MISNEIQIRKAEVANLKEKQNLNKILFELKFENIGGNLNYNF